MLEYSDEPLVSADIVGNPSSCIYSSLDTMANGKFVKVLGWYDNEWGYSNRLIDLVELHRRLRSHAPVTCLLTSRAWKTSPKLHDLRVLLRADFNVPLPDGQVEDDLRIATVLPTIQWLHEQGAAVVVCGHLGRPKGKPDPQFSMAPVAARLGELLGQEVALAPKVFGPTPASMIASLDAGDVMMLENLRFERGETENSPALAVSLCETVDAYVNEAFGASHREHASIVGPPRLLPSAAGRLLVREVEVLSGLLAAPSSRSSPCSVARRSATSSA